MKTEPPATIIEAAGISKRVDNGGTPLLILHENSFSVFEGETVAILGASGSGKSTLLGLLAGLDTPSEGRILIDGQDIGGMDEDSRALLRGRCIGFVFQSFQLLPSLNALENVMLPLELAGRPGAGKEAGLWLERVGLSHRLKHYPRHLSGGEQQRVALARAFAPKPKLILGDEPTGNLDEATGRRVIDLMFSINAESRATLVLATHDEKIAARCQRRLRMRAGEIEEIA
ncbi:MAG: ABC transporter ATP-binding protein [Candidatus Accumulibacter sp.]|jgi:putative ABC transport system ATP-binding protein|nr:ABC transporter ATP-binding protein [Accumulibacter sp.]